MVTFTINIPPMLAYIPYMDPMGIVVMISGEPRTPIVGIGSTGDTSCRFLHLAPPAAAIGALRAVGGAYLAGADDSCGPDVSNV